jgi:hypothetical protein
MASLGGRSSMTTKTQLIMNGEIQEVIMELERYRKDIENLINKEHFGRIMLRKFIKYANLLDLEDTKLSSENGRIAIKIDFPPHPPQRSYEKFRAMKALTLEARKWGKLHRRMMREAKPYLIADEL